MLVEEMKLPQRSFPRVRASASITPPSQPFQLPPKVDLAVVQPVMWPELDGKLRRDGISIPAPDLRSEKLAWVSMSTRQCWTRSGLFVLRTGPVSRDLPIECQRSFGRSPWFCGDNHNSDPSGKISGGSGVASIPATRQLDEALARIWGYTESKGERGR